MQNPAARLGGAPDLVRLDPRLSPAARLDLRPARATASQPRPSPGETARRRLVLIAATVAIHIGFAIAFAYLLTWRAEPATREVVTPVELVPEPPKPPSPAPPPPAAAPVPAPVPVPPAPSPQPLPPLRQEPQATPAAPDPLAQLQPPALTPSPLAVPPPEPSRAATQDRDSKTANAEPDQGQIDQATHEARPQAMPQVLTTADPSAALAVQPRAEPRPDPVARPAPANPAKTPSETDKLAAALPLDTSAMPSSFRAVLSGNGAQISAAYKGLVYGRFNRHPEIGERARRQGLKGHVIVAFTIDDAGRIATLNVLQSSGNTAIDALGLDLIRAASPFPPPPPEAQHSFTPALAFGE